MGQTLNPKGKSEESGGMNLVSFLNENWNLVISMMLGIRNAVASLLKEEEISHEQFKAKFGFQLIHKRTKASAKKVSSPLKSK